MLRIRWAALLTLLCILACCIGQPVKADDVSVTIGVGDTILVVQGKTSPNAFVTISRDGAVVGTTNADAAGIYSQTFPAQEPGLHQIHVVAQTVNGRQTDTISVIINIAEHATTTADIFLPPTLVVGQTDLAHDEPLQIQGETCPDCTVTVYIDDADVTLVAADASGNWNASISTIGFSSGEHSFFVRASDSLGAQSYPTTLRRFVLQPPLTSAVPGPTVPGAPGADGKGLSIPVITFPPGGITWTQPSITVRGTADPNVQIELFDDQTSLGSVWSNSNGEWELPIFLQSKEYTLRARACYAGVCSPLSESLFFISKIAAPLRIELPRSAFSIRKDQPLDLLATIQGGESPFKITVDWGDGSTQSSNQSNPQVDLSHVYTRSGNYAGWLEVEDTHSQRSKVYFTVKVGSGVPIVPMAIAFGMVLLILGVYTVLLHRHKKLNLKRG
ncbi:MAG TPA: hypothetical protein VFB59_03340 [Candidatus Saccharimonadales bacterium]|nr:hypothetical protein [Candidatus Saccharimonadales bacterium]